MDKNKKFVPPPEPEPCDDSLFDITSVASATECTGIGKVMPAFSDEDDGITDMYDMHIKSEKESRK